MSKRQKQTAFLKTLIMHGDVEVRAGLEERIKRAERDELCAWRALWLVGLLAVFSCVGICYSAVLIPGFFQNSSHIVVKVFCCLGLASLICAAAFLGCWMWCRAVLNRVQEDCRRYVMAMLEPAGPANFSPVPTARRERQNAPTHALVHTRAENERSTSSYPGYSQLFSFRRGS